MVIESGEIDVWIVCRWPGSRASSASVNISLASLVELGTSVESEDMRGEGVLSGVGKLNTLAGVLSASFVRTEPGECILGDSGAKSEDESEDNLPKIRWRARPSLDGFEVKLILRKVQMVQETVATRSQGKGCLDHFGDSSSCCGSMERLGVLATARNMQEVGTCR